MDKAVVVRLRSLLSQVVLGEYGHGEKLCLVCRRLDVECMFCDLRALTGCPTFGGLGWVGLATPSQLNRHY